MLSVVIPCFNEALVLDALAARLRPVLDGLAEPYEVVLVDDGSTDPTAAVLASLAESWPEVRVLRLTRNAGHQAALTAGLDVAGGDYVVTMDADLQDPPEVVPEMLRRARHDGVDVVYAVRSDRSSDTAFKRGSAGVYYRLLRRLSGVDLPPHAGDFRLLSARVVAVLRNLPERRRVYRLLVPSLGYPSAVVTHRREARAAGRTKYSVRHMVALTGRSVVSSSMLPLRLSALLGLAGAVACVVFATYAVIGLMLGHTVPGWASIMTAVLFVGAVQLVCVGVLGEYVGQVLEEVRHRPLYVVADDYSGVTNGNGVSGAGWLPPVKP